MLQKKQKAQNSKQSLSSLTGSSGLGFFLLVCEKNNLKKYFKRMPELPEVETLRRALVPLAEGKILKEANFLRADLRFQIPIETLQLNIFGQKVSEIRRKGKYLLFQFPSGIMIIHLGMSGRIVQCLSIDPEQKHTHAVFRIEGDIWLHFVDPRRFGCIVWEPKGTEHKLLRFQGPDPYSPEANAKAMKLSAQRCKGPIKSFLMNGQRIAGVGNIYACESLFSARINPNRPANKLSLKSWGKLLSVLRETLDRSIAAGGTTLKDFSDPSGTVGYFVLQLSVYGREGKACPECSESVCRIIHSGRSTFFCKRCQSR
jgi:formamidopyrimidine-DNA glycosylase